MRVIITGSKGQLGQAIQSVAHNYPEIDFIFCDFNELNITDENNCDVIFNKYKPQFCINTAAYTAVDKAESEKDKVFAINVKGSENLANICKKYDVILLHISTDFVFDGMSNIPYKETDITNPINVYGQTKLDGEKIIQNIYEKYYIIRTSWLYSQFGNNFMKTMLKLSSERDKLSVVSDQIGTPTNAINLAEVILSIIKLHYSSESKNYGIYHFSNEGQCSWYEFAKEIFRVNNINIDLYPIKTSEYPTLAKRPQYSVLDKTKIKEVFNVEIKDWKEVIANSY